MAKNWSKGTQPLSSQQRTEGSEPIPPTTPVPAASPAGAVGEEEASRRLLLRVIQPGLAGLMDGSVSTLAPIFATAFATHRPFTAFLVGMAAATGAGISMAFSEALSDDGALTGRGNPVLRGSITGGMTFLGGSLHTLPFLVPDLHLALLIAYIVVAVELVAIAAIRYRFLGTRWWLSILQVVGGGALVFAAAWIFGNA
jgi:VIT1/CCC1 family predicted Fe2+/Mn2+ transporter